MDDFWGMNEDRNNSIKYFKFELMFNFGGNKRDT